MLLFTMSLHSIWWRSVVFLCLYFKEKISEGLEGITGVVYHLPSMHFVAAILLVVMRVKRLEGLGLSHIFKYFRIIVKFS